MILSIEKRNVEAYGTIVEATVLTVDSLLSKEMDIYINIKN